MRVVGNTCNSPKNCVKKMDQVQNAITFSRCSTIKIQKSTIVQRMF